MLYDSDDSSSENCDLFKGRLPARAQKESQVYEIYCLGILERKVLRETTAELLFFLFFAFLVLWRSKRAGIKCTSFKDFLPTSLSFSPLTCPSLETITIR